MAKLVLSYCVDFEDIEEALAVINNEKTMRQVEMEYPNLQVEFEFLIDDGFYSVKVDIYDKEN